jgi:signal transduction histidine kinase
MTELLNDAILQIKSQAEAKGIQLEARIESMPEMKVDKRQMKQSLLNLLLNAIEATSAGGKIYINAYAKAQEVRIEIADTGVGIPEENLSKIFDLYFTTKDTGTGIGLALVNRIVTEHGGRIEVSSQEGKGTTFVLSLLAK